MPNLVTLDDYKVYEGINGTNEDDKLEVIVTSVNALVRTYCNSTIIDNYATVITEYADIQWDTHVVQLKKSPIVQNANFKVYERTSQSEAYTRIYRDGGGSPAEYSWAFDDVTDSIMRTNEDGTYTLFPKGVKCVKIEYNYGYATTPYDLKLGIVDLITYYRNKEHKPRFTLGSATVQNKSVNSEVAEVGFPEHIRRILDMYKI